MAAQRDELVEFQPRFRGEGKRRDHGNKFVCASCYLNANDKADLLSLVSTLGTQLGSGVIYGNI